MSNCRAYLFAVFAAIMLVSPAYSWTEWNYTSGSHLWSNAANWSPHVPLSGEDPIIRGQGAGKEALIDSSVAAVGNAMWVGYSGQADLNITGGSLTLGSGFRLGVTGGPGNVNVSGGTVTVTGDMVVGDGASGVGTLTMNGGAVNHVSGWLYVGYLGATGTIHVDGGTLSTFRVVMGSGNPLVDITSGKLIITNTDSVGVATEINGYIGAVQLTFYGGNPSATHTLTVNGSGYTEITASLPTAAKAYNPNPVSLSTEIGMSPSLSWSAGTGTVSHDVYFGTASPGSFRCNQTATTYNPVALLPNTTYYWRIDEKNNVWTTTGDVWSFTTVTLPWSDNFNTGSFTAGGWTAAGIGTTVNSNAGYPSGYGARLRGTTSQNNSLIKSKSTEGYNGIHIKYDRRVTSTSASSITLIVEWSADGGSSWTNLETVSGSIAWVSRDYSPSSSLNNNPNFRLRFRTTGGTYYYAYIDNVQITGTPLAMVIVPTVVGMAQAAATTAITSAGLSVGTITQQYSGSAAGNVISQNPTGGTTVATGSTVDIVVSLGSPVVPTVVGMTQAAATSTITAATLTVGPLAWQYSDTVPAGLVISQSPVGGTPATVGMAVNMTISLGRPVPRVVGMTESAATSAITSVGLTVGPITRQYSETASGFVIGQHPIGGTPVSGGSSVDLIVSLGNQPAVPNVVGMTQTAATTAITAVSLATGAVTEQYSGSIPAGNVISQNPATGTIVNIGSDVNLVISRSTVGADAFYEGFANPPFGVSPGVYWFWNANAISESEISRELDLLKAAGIGGVLIFPLQEPMAATKVDEQPLQWLSPQWALMLKFTADAAQARGMYVDLLVGTGWPFGGPFVQAGDQIKIIKLGTTELTGPGTFSGNIRDLMVLPPGAWGETTNGLEPGLQFLRLVPKNPQNFQAGTELKDQVQPDGSITFAIPSGQYVLYTGTYREGFLVVNIAAPGGAGPVVDHLNSTALNNYLGYVENALKPYLGEQIGQKLRSLHCDSFELTNANWTADFAQEFLNRRGYAIDPYLPFIVEWPPASGGSGFNDTVNRVQYDFWKTQQELFNERFLTPFNEWCHNEGTDSRSEAYGCYEIDPIENKLIADRPMGETWIAMVSDIPTSEVLIPVDKQISATNMGIWSCRANKYTSSAAHLAGRAEVSCETMTSGSSAFRLRPQDIKVALDLDFVSGINQTYYHGYNWSPPKAGFPGWFYCGSYIDDKELWWPYFEEVNKYHSRLSWVLQNSVSRSQVGLISWESFLWEALHQNGYCVDYINEKIIRDAASSGGKLTYGPQSYELLILNRVDAVEPATATALANFVNAGGKIIFVDYPPYYAPGLADAVNRSNLTNSIITAMIQQHPDKVFVVAGTDNNGWFNWVPATLAQTGIVPTVQITPPDRLLYQIHQSVDNRDIFFFANLDINSPKTFAAHFNITNKTPWRWDPTSGVRYVVPYNYGTNMLNMTLKPVESLLLVFEPNQSGTPVSEPVVHADDYLEINSPWDLTLNRVSDCGGAGCSVSYDIYFGTDFNAVNTASRLPFDFSGDGIVDLADLAAFSQQWMRATAEFDFDDSGIVNFVDFASFAAQFYTEAVPEFLGNQTTTTLSPGVLGPNTTYYWRVDEVTDSATFKGQVWHFTAGP